MTNLKEIFAWVLAGSLFFQPAFALADRGRGGDDESRHHERSLPQTPGIANASSHMQFSDDEWRGHTDNGIGNGGRNRGRGSENSGPGSVNRHHDDDDDECISPSGSSSLSVRSDDDDEDRDDDDDDRHGIFDDNDDDCDIVNPGDVTAPTISGVTAAPGVSTTTIAWTTNEPATSRVFFGTANPLDVNASTTQSVNVGTLVTSHAITLSGLTASTTYRFIVRSLDAAGNVATSGQFSFTTQAAPVPSAPVLSAIAAAPGVSTSTISWNTDTPANGTVFFSTLNPLDLNATTTLSITNPALLVGHSFALSGLTASTTYFFVVRSANAAGTTTSATFSFLTMADTTPPVLASIAATTTPGTASFTWTTNEPATSKVFFATTTPVNLATASSVSSSTLVTSHSIVVSGLTASTTFHFVLQSTDAFGNTATSSDIGLLIP